MADTRFVLDALETLYRDGKPDAALPAGLSLDLSRVGMLGHSAGGFTTGETMVADRRIDAGADLDGSMAYSQSARDFGRVADEGLDRPFLLLSAGDHSAASDASWQEFLRPVLAALIPSRRPVVGGDPGWHPDHHPRRQVSCR